MKGAIAWFAANHVAANLLMAMLVFGGLFTIPTITQKVFPDIDVEMIAIFTEYRGAAPEEVEEGVCIRIEEEIDGIEGIEKIRSTSVEGACSVMAELIMGTDVAKALDDIKNRIDAIDTFPENIEKPVISHVALRRPVIDVAISGPADERSLRVLGQRVRDEIAMLPGITQADLTYVRPYEISIEVPEESLRRHGMTFDQLVAAVRRSSLDLPGGSIKTAGGEILLRTKGQAYRGPEFERIVVLTRPDGTRVAVDDVASVIDGFEDIDISARFDGEPGVTVQVFRVGDQDAVEIADLVKQYVAAAQPRMPEGIKLTIWQDTSLMLKDRLDTLVRNGRSGFILVLLILTLFLRTRLAFWTTIGVPISFLGALWVMPALDISIDVISLFAFIVVLGILVDDAIVVGENVHTHEARSETRLEAAIKGTQEVAIPVIFGVLTTVAAFTPMLMVPGPMGQIFKILATVVILCLTFSLIESQLVLPAHLAHGRLSRASPGEGESELRGWFGAIQSGVRRVQDAAASGMERFGREVYAPFLGLALEWRYLTVATGMAFLLATFGVLASGRMHFSFFPPIEADHVAALLTMPQGTPEDVTARAVRRLEQAAQALREELDPIYSRPGETIAPHVLASVGQQPYRDRQSQNPQALGSTSSAGAHLGEVVLELSSPEERDISATAIANRWRELTGPVPDAVELVFVADLFSAGDAINIQLMGPDVRALREIADRVKLKLAEYPGVIDVSDSFRAGKKELKLSILPTAESLGLTAQDLARQVRQAFYGEEAQRVQRGRDDVRVMVRYPEAERHSLGDVEGMRIRNRDGTEVAFGIVAQADLGRGFAAIRRSDRQRVVNVTADVDRSQTTANDVLASLLGTQLPRIIADYPGVTFSLEGEQREQQRALGGLLRAAGLALVAIYALLAIPLRSYAQPLLIMSVIPFGVVGAIAGHLLLGRSLSFMSIVGIVALSGVVVNASLVLVDYVNRRRDSGLTFVEAVQQAGVARFRPIVLTSMTTFAGLTPLILERSVQAQFLIPMAVSLAYGVVFATAITLLLVPSGYLIIEDLKGLATRQAGSARR